MATVTDWVSFSALALIASAVGINTARGTLPDWLRAKFLLEQPPPAVIGIPENIGAPFPPPTTPIPPMNPNPGGGGGRYADPAPGARLISGFGACRTGITCSGPCCRRHKGIDLAAASGTPVYSIAPGRVSSVFNQSGSCGLGVTIRHGDGSEALYCHLSSRMVSRGQTIPAAGVPVGRVGNTGNATGTTPHLHFEIRTGGRSVDPTRLIGR